MGTVLWKESGHLGTCSSSVIYFLILLLLLLIAISPKQFFSIVQHGDPVTHTCIHRSFFSHYHALSQVTRHSSQCYTSESHC